jgi:hypothetical protein
MNIPDFGRKVLAMKSAFVLPGLLLLAQLPRQIGHAQSAPSPQKGPDSITIVEPGRIPLPSLFKMSDVVAVVRVASGDTVDYESAVYKAVVVTGFKGAIEGQTLYFGPFIRQRLGFESVLFLRKANEPATPKGPRSSFGTVPYLNVFNEGYSSMEIGYECTLNGKEIDNQCDYGVRICTDYIILPESTETAPPSGEETPFGCRWVRKTTFLSLLKDIAEPGALHLQ